MALRPFGSLLLAEDLASDALGVLSRGWERTGPDSVRPILVRRFAPALRAPQICDALGRAAAGLDLPAGCGTGHAFGVRPEPHWRLHFRPSRSLRSIAEACRREAFPFGLAQSLNLAWSLVHLCAAFWRKGQSAGFLSLDSVRVDFEGGLFLPDLAWHAPLVDLAESEPRWRSLLAGLPRHPRGGSLEEEARRLGRFLVELFSFRNPPAEATAATLLAEARLWTPEGEEPLPPEILGRLERLLGGAEPFPTLDEGLMDLEGVVFDVEGGPSTFNLAYLMHTLFRREYERQQAQLAEEQELAAHSGLWEPPARPADPLRPGAPRRGRGLALAGGVLLLSGIAAGAYVRTQERQRQDLETQLASLQAEYARQAQGQADAEAQARLRARIEQLHQAARSDAQRERVQAVLASVPPAPPPRPPVAAEPVVRPAAGAPPATSMPDQDAQVLRLEVPDWPAVQTRSQVRLRVFLHETGRPLRVLPAAGLAASPEELQAATAAAMRSSYRPARQGGRPVRDWIEVQFSP